MKNIFALLKKDKEERTLYFSFAKEEIAKKNLEQIKFLSPMVTGLLLLFFCLAWFIIKDWQITPVHIAFWPVMAAFSLFIRAKETCSTRCVFWYSWGFEVLVLLFCGLIDLSGGPNAPGSFLPLVLVALPIVFILPLEQQYALLSASFLFYAAACYQVKSVFVCQYDIFNAAAGLFISLPLAHTVLRLRIRDQNTQTRYKYLSMTDVLSSLLNKAACEEAVKDYLKWGQNKTGCALVMLDIDDFKQVNDTQGHYIGDMLLQKVGGMLKQQFRTSDVVARFGGDEFVAFLKDCADPLFVEKKCQSIQQELCCISQQQRFAVTCSMGCVYAKAGQKVDFVQLLKQADRALYEAKHSGKNAYELHGYADALSLQ